MNNLYDIVKKMKESLQKITKALENFNSKYIERKSRPMTPEDYD